MEIEDLEKEYGIKGRPHKIALYRIAEDEERGDFDLPPAPTHKDKFDSVRSCAGLHFSMKAPHPDLRNLAKPLECAAEGPATASSSKIGDKTSSTSGIATHSNDADDEISSMHLEASNESTSSVNTFLSVSSKMRDDGSCSSLVSVASYHTALTGPYYAYNGAESVIAVTGPSFSTALCASPKNSEAGPSKKIASTTDRNNASNDQPAVGEPRAIISSRTDPDATSLKSENTGSPNRYQKHWHALPWAISWLTTLVLLCAFIGKNHDPLKTPNLSGQGHNKTKRMTEENATSWMTFRHGATFVFNIQCSEGKCLNVTASNKTRLNTRNLMGRDRVTPIAWGAHSDETWDPMLFIEHVNMLNSSWVTVNTSLTAEHRVNLTAVCHRQSGKDEKESSISTSSIKPSTSISATGPTTSTRPYVSASSIKIQPPASATRSERPTTSTTPRPLLQSLQLKETRAVTYAKNLLTCLWFLPVWLLALFIARKCRLTWLKQGESEIRVQITAIVLSFSLAAALALATTESVIAIMESTRGT